MKEAKLNSLFLKGCGLITIIGTVVFWNEYLGIASIIFSTGSIVIDSLINLQNDQPKEDLCER